MNLELYKNFFTNTYTDKKLHFLNPRTEDICIEDIAHALSYMCRFNGHCKSFYSVAQHSIFVADMLPTRLAPYGLLHDATEVYVTDIPRPLKKLIDGAMEGELKKIEYDIHHCINRTFNLPNLLEEDVNAIKLVDNSVLVIEAHNLMTVRNFDEWIFGDIVDEIEMKKYNRLKNYYLFMKNTEQEFLNKFKQLIKESGNVKLES
jgi:5'-deoxynucleotidase YfbR-like HD superfamily hydrolase